MMKDEDIIAKLAEFMGWKLTKNKVTEYLRWVDKDGVEQRNAEEFTGVVSGRVHKAWNPLEDWNHWRQVEEKVMEDDVLWHDFVHCDRFKGDFSISYMKSTPEERCKALVSVLDSNE